MDGHAQAGVEIAFAEDAEAVRACHAVMALLRPHLDEAAFVARIGRMQNEGYRLVALRVAGDVQAVAGYRIMECLRTGPMLEVEDLVSSTAARSHGHGKRLLDWCLDRAREAGCSVLELDSAVHRADAHRFYFRERMHVLGFHFSRSTGDLP